MCNLCLPCGFFFGATVFSIVYAIMLQWTGQPIQAWYHFHAEAALWSVFALGLSILSRRSHS